MSLAPIALFVYKRPEHTLNVLQHLKQNRLAEKSELTVFCDGLKPSATEADRRQVQRVREIASSGSWCGNVRLVMRDQNLGLATSIVEGVTQLTHEQGKVIVLEDDLVTSRGFLEFLNRGLEQFANEEQVMHVGAYMYPRLRLPFPSGEARPSFIKFMACWGWATWKRAWNHYNNSAHDLLAAIRAADAMDRFCLEGAARSLEAQLTMNVDGVLNTWAIKWYASIFLRDGLCLCPSESLVRNIGNDGSGTHTDKTDLYMRQTICESVRAERPDPVEDPQLRRQVRNFFRYLEKKKSLLDKMIDKFHLLR